MEGEKIWFSRVQLGGVQLEGGDQVLSSVGGDTIYSYGNCQVLIEFISIQQSSLSKGYCIGIHKRLGPLRACQELWCDMILIVANHSVHIRLRKLCG